MAAFPVKYLLQANLLLTDCSIVCRLVFSCFSSEVLLWADLLVTLDIRLFSYFRWFVDHFSTSLFLFFILFFLLRFGLIVSGS